MVSTSQPGNLLLMNTIPGLPGRSQPSSRNLKTIGMLKVMNRFHDDNTDVP